MYNTKWYNNCQYNEKLSMIVRERWIDYICESFSETGKVVGSEEAGIISDLMQCHSWYVQQLSHYTRNLTQKKSN